MAEEKAGNNNPSSGSAGRDSMLVLYWTLFLRYKVPVTACVLAAVILGAILHLVSPPMYRAGALVLPPQSDRADGLPGEIAGMAGDFAKTLLPKGSMVEQHVDILKSNRTLDMVIDRLNLAERYEGACRDSLRNRLTERCDFKATDGGLINISTIDESPKLAMEMAASFVNALSEIEHEINKSKASRQREFLEKRVAEVEMELENTQQAWRSFQEKHRLIRVDQGLTATATVMGELEARRIAKEIELQVKETVYAQESPEIEILKTEIAQLEKKLEEIAKNGIRSPDNADEHQWLFPAVKKVPSLALEQMELERKMSLHIRLYELLTNQLELARIAEARERASIQVISPPTLPELPTGHGMFRKMAIAGLAAALIFLLIGSVIVTDPSLVRRTLSH